MFSAFYISEAKRGEILFMERGEVKLRGSGTARRNVKSSEK